MTLYQRARPNPKGILRPIDQQHIRAHVGEHHVAERGGSDRFDWRGRVALFSYYTSAQMLAIGMRTDADTRSGFVPLLSHFLCYAPESIPLCGE